VGEIAQLYQRNRPQHDKNAKEWTKLHAKPENASPPVVDTGKSTASTSTTSAPKEKQKEKPAASRPPRNTTGERPIVIDGDDDEVQIVGVKRPAPDSSTNTRSTRSRTSNANNASGSGSSSNNVIELD
jgi:ubiquitin-conjugating enzyme E2 D/E